MPKHKSRTDATAALGLAIIDAAVAVADIADPLAEAKASGDVEAQDRLQAELVQAAAVLADVTRAYRGALRAVVEQHS